MLSAAETVLESRVLILAGGIIRGEKFPGEQQWMGRGVSYCATCDGMLYRKKRVVVYGETESAEQEANYLKEIGCIVVYLSRRPGTGEAGWHHSFYPYQDAGIGRRYGAYPCAGRWRKDCLRRRVFAACVRGAYGSDSGACDPGWPYPCFTADGNEFSRLVCGLGDCTGQPYQIAKAVGEGQVAALAAVSWLDRRPE